MKKKELVEEVVLDCIEVIGRLMIAVCIAALVVTLFVMPYQAHCRDLGGEWIGGGCMENGEYIAF